MEHNLAKVGVAGSIPVSRSHNERTSKRMSFFVMRTRDGEMEVPRGRRSQSSLLRYSSCAFSRGRPARFYERGRMRAKEHTGACSQVCSICEQTIARQRDTNILRQQNMSPLALVFISPKATFCATYLFYVAFSSCICFQMLRISPLPSFT